MALVVEDGTGKPDAESYASAADADAYHLARATAAWAALDTPTKEASLRKATDYVETVYAGGWQGMRRSGAQMLEWPRSGVPDLAGGLVGVDVIPRRLVMAICELALKASTGVLLKDEGQRAIEKTVGPLTIKYAEDAPVTARYQMVENLLGPYLAGAASPGGMSGQVRLMRS